MKKQAISMICMLILICIILCGCSNGASSSAIAKIEKEETYPEAPGQLEKEYTSLPELASDAAVIAKVLVVDQSVEDLDGLPQTHTQVRVIKDYLGNVKSSDIIEVVEEGGREGKVFGGIPQMKTNDEMYLFLIEYNNYFYVCGAFQGRFVVRDGYVFQQATEDTKLKSYAPLDDESFGETVASLVKQNGN